MFKQHREKKCERCWKYSENLNEEGLCPRCAAVIQTMDLTEEVTE